MKLRTKVAPLALGLVMAVSTARVAGAQSPSPQPAQQPPAAGQPATGQPATGQPATGQPATGQPATGQPATGQPAAGAQPAAAAQDATFTGGVGVLLVQVKGDQTAAYESLITKLKESLAKNEKPERKAMASGWKVYKSSEPMNGNTLYVHIVDPVSPGQNYLETYKLISETFPAEVQDLYGKTKDAFVPGGLGRLNLTLVQALGTP
jgi:hypothetical protein